ADRFVIPDPRLWVDWFSDRAKQAQGAEIPPRGPLGAPTHERAYRGRGRVEDRDAVSLDDFPEAIFLRPVRRPFVHDHRGAVRERAVDDIAVTGDPADVGSAPKHVVFLQIE